MAYCVVRSVIKDRQHANPRRWIQAPEVAAFIQERIHRASNSRGHSAQRKQGWLRGLGEHAELIVPTYGVIVHGIPTNSINTNGLLCNNNMILIAED